jgi:hypothetical protein
MSSAGQPRFSASLIAGLAVAVFMMLSAGLAHGQSGKGSEQRPDMLDVKKFSRSTEITNKWMPMKPGTRWIYEGVSIEDDGKAVPHRIEITTTDLVKSIGALRAVISYDIDYTDNELVEAELAFYAQDDAGNVWLLGEYPEEYEDGKLIKAPAWIHGFQDARAGIMMQAEPRLGTPSYAQGWGPAVGWTDRATTYQMGQKTKVPAGSFEDVLVIKESARAEPDAEQLKYYAPGVGNVRVGWIGSEVKAREVLELIRVEQLSPEALAQVRSKAWKLEQSAQRHSKEVYARTKPAMLANAAPTAR